MHERYVTCRQFGADVHLLNPAIGGLGFLAYMKELCEKPNHFYLNQMENMANPAAHISATGPEIYAQTEGNIDIFIHGIGTGGCISGVGQYLKSKKPDVKARLSHLLGCLPPCLPQPNDCRTESRPFNPQVIALEPSEGRVHVGEPFAKHGIVGWAPGFHSRFLEGADWEVEQLSDSARGKPVAFASSVQV